MRIFQVCTAALLFACSASARPAITPPALDNLPMIFESSDGCFRAKGTRYSVLLTPVEATFQLGTSQAPTTLKLTLLGGNPKARGVGLDLRRSTSHYFLGNDPGRWQTGMRNFERVRYESVYPGIDVLYHGHQRDLEFDFEVAPAAEPSIIRLGVSRGMKLRLNRHGDLVVETLQGNLIQRKPVAYQKIGGRRLQIPVRYVIRANNEIVFRLGNYDRGRPLIIDPVLSYSTFLGGALADSGNGIAVDPAGNIYVTGVTYSTNFPVVSPLQSSIRTAPDVFVSKFNPTGTALIYCTYIGSDNLDFANAIAVDASGNAYITGYTAGSNFPTLNAYQANRVGNTDAFITKLGPTGSLLYSTYFGSPNGTQANGIAVDSTGIYIAGQTFGLPGLPLANPIQSIPGGSWDGFVAKLNPAGSAVVYSTYLGGNDVDVAYAIAVDSSGNAYIAGQTNSTNFPLANAIQRSFGIFYDGFVAKISAAGNTLLFSTYLGGSGSDQASGIAVDSTGVYVAGRTDSANFPLFQPLQGGGDAHGSGFISKLNLTGSALLYSTYLGNSGTTISGVAVDSAGNAYVAGSTFGSQFPTVAAIQNYTNDPGQGDAIVAKLNPAGSALLYSTYLGSAGHADRGLAIAVGVTDAAHVTGYTYAPDFPTRTPFQPMLGGGGGDAFVTGIIDDGVCSFIVSPANLSFPALGGSAPVTVTAPAGCNWNAIRGASWVSIAGPPGLGSGSVAVTVDYADGPTRLGSLVVAGKPVTVTQAGFGCTYSIVPLSQEFPAAGGPGTATVVTASGCTATAVSNAPWITITSGANTVSGGIISFTVAANTSGAPRSGTITAAGLTATVNQSQDANCPVSLINPSSTYDSVGGIAFASFETPFTCGWTASSNTSWLTIVGPASGIGSGYVTISVAPNTGAPRVGTVTVGGKNFTVNEGGQGAPSGLRFFPVTPCRVIDTRLTVGPFGGPTLPAAGIRNVAIPASNCNIPPFAAAYSLNVTVVPSGALSFLTLWPTGQPQPFVSTLNSFDGRIKANAAIVPAGASGQVSVYVTDATDVILDINGYFAPAFADNMAFYPVTPCRIADTRLSAGPFGGPSMAAAQTRSFVIASAACGIPSGAQAYSFNMTVVPSGPLAFLTAWPTGQPQPGVSTLNAFTGTVTANAAIVPAGAGGAISVYVTNPTDLVIDINGYFAPPGSPGQLLLYPVTPCRIADTRTPPGSFGAPAMVAGQPRDFPVTASNCGLPSSAKAYSLNATVVPIGPLAFLTLWPAGQPQPLVSTLNAFDGTVASNAAILPAGAGGSVSAYATSQTHMILDVNGYFAP